MRLLKRKGRLIVVKSVQGYFSMSKSRNYLRAVFEFEYVMIVLGNNSGKFIFLGEEIRMRIFNKRK